MKKAKAIQDINSDNKELHDWQQASIIQTVKNKFMFNIDAETYKTPQQILGCVDALKILWVISKGRVSSSNTEKKQEDEVIKQLIAIPTSYTLTVKLYPIVGKVYSPIKIVLSDISGCEDEEIDVEELDSIVLSDVVATVTSTTTAPLATIEDCDDVPLSGGSNSDIATS